MTRSRFLVLLILIASLNANSSESDSPIELAEVHGDVTVQDLFNLSTFLGFHFKIFDYETDGPHCVHFYVDAKLDIGESSRHDGRGLCSLGGPQRLTVQWKVEADLLEFRFLQFRRDIDQGSSVQGPRIQIPLSDGHSLKRVDSPLLQMGDPTILLHVSLRIAAPEQRRMDFKVLVELRPNPNQVIGTE